jgi:hypothetical protein
MKLLNTPAIGLLTLTCSVFTDVALAMTRHQVPNFRSPRFLAAPPGDSTTTASTVLNATFEQLIDHDNPSLGTFSQFYYYSTEFYKGPGSPVVSTPMIPWQMAVPECVQLQTY